MHSRKRVRGRTFVKLKSLVDLSRWVGKTAVSLVNEAFRFKEARMAGRVRLNYCGDGITGVMMLWLRIEPSLRFTCK